MGTVDERGLRTAPAGEGPSEAGAPTLRVFADGKQVFSSYGRWLHPLFELEDFLAAESYGPERLTIEDKVIGRAAAFLMVRMGFRTVHGHTMSRLAQEVFEARGVAYTFGTLIERIGCRTESLLADVEEAEQAYALVRGLAER